MPLSTLSMRIKSLSPLKPGDWLMIGLGMLLVVYLFKTLWTGETASKLQIRVGDNIYATYDLNVRRDIHIHGRIGESIIHIADGKARFAKSPCGNQYCVHQGWLTRAGQAAICLPNQVSLELIGSSRAYDSLNY